MILAVDQGTSGTTCLVVDPEFAVLGRGFEAVAATFPAPGLVEQDPEELLRSVDLAAQRALADAGVRVGDVHGLAIATQRETTVVWDRDTGLPVHRAIVWQDRRTAERCRELPRDLIRDLTGLVPDPYFSATKVEWILRESAPPRGDLAFGTVDSWIAWKLSEGRLHVTDVTNASRTMLMNIHSQQWDDTLLELFEIDRALLPRIEHSGSIRGEVSFLGATIPLAALVGDQQAALFGHACYAPGEGKATYGTGSFVLVNSGSNVPPAVDGVLRTVCATTAGSAPEYAFEGSVLSAGAAVQWLRDGLGIISSASEIEDLAREVDDSAGVVFVPALTGLGSPHWNPEARGLIAGLTRGTSRAHLARATLEAIALQVADVVDPIPVSMDVLRADGGATANRLLMQLQADLLGCPVETAREPETTAIGAAALAGIALGSLRDRDEFAQLLPRGDRFEPRSSPSVEALKNRWRAVMAGVVQGHH